MRHSAGSEWSLTRLARLGLMGGAGVLALCAREPAYADPACPGVGVSSTNGDAVIDASSPGVECVLIPGAELNMNGAVAPVVDFGAPADGMTTGYSYDVAGQITAETVPTGSSTAASYDMIYDAQGRLVAETTIDAANPAGVTTTYTYDALGRLVTETAAGASGYTDTYTYDALGRLLSETETGPSGATTSYQYDTGSSEVVGTTGSDATTYTYDALDRVTQVTDDPSGNTTTYLYDPSDMVLTETDPGSLVTTYTYDGNNLVSSLVVAGDDQTTYTHDADGRLITSTDDTGATTAFVYAASLIPEPSSLLLLAGGLACWLGVGRKRHRRDDGRA